MPRRNDRKAARTEHPMARCTTLAEVVSSNCAVCGERLATHEIAHIDHYPGVALRCPVKEVTRIYG